MYSGIALSGLASLDCCIVSSFWRFIDEKSQMKAPRMSAYFAKLKLGSHLDAFVDQVVVRAVAQAVRTVDHRHQRRRSGLFLVGVGLIDGSAIFGTACQ